MAISGRQYPESRQLNTVQMMQLFFNLYLNMEPTASSLGGVLFIIDQW